MNNFLKNKNKSFFKLSLIGILIGSFFLFTWIFLNLFFDKNNQLAQINKIETKLLMEWRKSKGLKKDLRIGSHGSEVALLQKILAQDPDIYPEKKISGYYGKKTQEAVLKFQGEYNLPQTGIVDETTRNKLNEILFKFLCPEPGVIYPDLSFRKIRKNQKLPFDYIPTNLINITDKVKSTAIVCLKKEVAESLIQMLADAEKEGIHLAITSGFRSPDFQRYLYKLYLRIQGSSALDMVAEPGASEHQLGTTVDFTDSSISYQCCNYNFHKSKAYKWLEQNAYKYGFVLSYPKNAKKTTGYIYEPWHWRFVGQELAIKLHNEQITFNESLLEPLFKPYPKQDLYDGLRISGNAMLSMYINPDGEEYVLLEKNKEQRMSISDLTKLMVALVASDIYNLNDSIVITQNSFDNNNLGSYNVGDTFYFNDALKAYLFSADKEMAIAIAEKIGIDNFIKKMNEKAKALGLNDTYFLNIINSNSQDEDENSNYSTVFDIAKLFKYLFENRSDLFAILENNEYSFNEIKTGRKIHLKTNANLVLNKNFVAFVLDKKDKKILNNKMNFVIITPAPVNGIIINVVFDSENYFDDISRLLNYIQNSFVWQ